MEIRRSSYALLPQSSPDDLPASSDSMAGWSASAFSLPRHASGIDLDLSHEDFPLNSKAASDRSSGGSSSGKSWAQQTEESYQLQLALALRLSSEATSADDPYSLDHHFSKGLPLTCSPEAISHRFWVNGCLSYNERVPDGFYLIHGLDPYVWTMCIDLQENGRVPSLESLKAVDPCGDSPIGAVLIDRLGDPVLKHLQDVIFRISRSCSTTEELVDQLARLVFNHMGGSALHGEDDLYSNWKKWSDILKGRLRSVVVPVGSLSVGLCRHRALLFKVLADTINLPCRIAKGCKYCLRDDASSCLVQFGPDREYFVDLIGKPGHLCGPDSLVNGPSSICISSPLRFPGLKSCESQINVRLLAEQYFSDSQMLNLVFSDAIAVGLSVQDGDFHMFGSCNPPESITHPEDISWEAIHHNHDPFSGHGDNQPTNPRVYTREERSDAVGLVLPANSSQVISQDTEDFDIAWNDLIMGETIGSGSFGTVHRATWQGADVAVKILVELDFYGERHKEFLAEFLREVAIMKRLRHPNIVLFMGAVTQPPKLCIVTEYLPRGSLYLLLHRTEHREKLDESRRLNMAYDVAKGMNYLHKRKPPIVHRDLKSPNLLVDKTYKVKVCDFGLSRSKANTYLSSKTAAGTPEWMAPEVLRDEPSNEKSDVYSFGVILWELATLQLPWTNQTPAQVILAVGFKGKRLEIPQDVNPRVASIIEACWADEPWKRPSFSTITGLLKPLAEPLTPQTSIANTSTHLAM